MSHVALVGDSIFDNAAYVPGQPAVIDQLRACLAANWQATLLARDGAVCSDVDGQVRMLTEDVTHVCLSVGGNDALRASGVLQDTRMSCSDGFDRLVEVQLRFRAAYQRTLELLLARQLPTIACTIYSRVPGLTPRECMGLSLFNDVITEVVSRCGIPLIDLRSLCDEPRDYAEVSPIEPSVLGGEKIAVALRTALLTHNFTSRRTTVFAS